MLHRDHILAGQNRRRRVRVPRTGNTPLELVKYMTIAGVWTWGKSQQYCQKKRRVSHSRHHFRPQSTHTSMCAGLSEVCNHCDRSSGKTHGCWCRSESREDLGRLQGCVLNIHLCLIIKLLKEKKNNRFNVRNCLILGWSIQNQQCQLEKILWRFWCSNSHLKKKLFTSVDIYHTYNLTEKVTTLCRRGVDIVISPIVFGVAEKPVCWWSAGLKSLVRNTRVSTLPSERIGSFPGWSVEFSWPQNFPTTLTPSRTWEV